MMFPKRKTPSKRWWALDNNHFFYGGRYEAIVFAEKLELPLPSHTIRPLSPLEVRARGLEQ